MNQRQRVLTLLGGDQPDRVPWFADLDYYTTGLIDRGERPADFKQSDAYIDWHRALGTGFYLQGYMPFRQISDGCSIEEKRDGLLRHRRVSTPRGDLTETWKWTASTVSEAPIERLVKSAADLPAYRYYYENLRFEPDHALAERRRQLVDDVGVVLCYTPRSPFMRLVAIDAGIQNLIPLFMDAREELEETLRIMKNCLDHAVDLTVQGPADIIMIPENLSSEVVGTTFFDMYMRQIQSDWVDRIHGAGKYSTMHLDGTLRGLLRQEAEIGFTFIEAMTPAPAGDLPVEEWKEYLEGTDVIAWGGIPGAFFSDEMSDAEFDAFVIGVLAVMREEPRYVLGVADQVPPDGSERRIRRVGELVEQYGRYE
ncbi:MAG TPA: uroporphyrinogen decarboxylase family protein [Candidatus Latescibacteria bacterium]|jgi:hypothetical protein|nr:hypothetical protein [Candidatus Latescibacterota bacterium]HJP32315.1 uroporphyrinogen decarboxylase family protein [Candidatus Latescibacterota bacterium]